MYDATYPTVESDTVPPNTLQRKITGPEFRDSLLQSNYFPRNSKDASDLPPCFSSKKLTNSVAVKVVGCGEKATKGFDTVKANLTRYDFVSRAVEIPHPMAYCSLVLGIEKYWDKIPLIENNSKSKIRINKHLDGRMFSMNPVEQEKSISSFGKNYLVTADISHFYSSIYTHSIAWALGGYDTAKRNTSQSFYYNKIDALYSKTRRSETSGISIGPATSALAAEIILLEADQAMNRFEYERFIDDYKFYAKDESQANEFLFELQENLVKYRLTLNPRKTTIHRLPIASTPAWIRKLRNQLDVTRANKFKRPLEYIDLAIDLTSTESNISALKWALTAIENEESFKSKKKHQELLDSLFSLSYHQPVLVPFIARILIRFKTISIKNYEKRINQLIRIHSQFDRTDCVTWLLYLSIQRGVSLRPKAIESIIQKKDCLSLLLLSQFNIPDVNLRIIDFCNSLFGLSPNGYELHQYWILLHELKLRDNTLFNQLANSNRSLAVLRKNNISFLDFSVPLPPPSIAMTRPPSGSFATRPSRTEY